MQHGIEHARPRSALLDPPADDVASKRVLTTDATLGMVLVERVRALLAQYPMRLTGTAGERGLQRACVNELTARGGSAEWSSFRWGRSIYQSLALHFGLATFGLPLALRAPWPAAALHLVVALSYISESMWKRPLLRWVLPTVRSQNAIVTFAAKTAVRHRIVTLAHADAAYTGVLFNPAIVKLAAKETNSTLGRAFRKGLALATFTLFPLAALEIALPWLPRASLALGFVLVLPSLAAFLLNLDVVVRNRVVPAANDNLSGVVATLEIAARLADQLPPDIELVTVITGCEEAGTGGAASLARQRRWSPENTTVLALDTFTNGEPRLLQEGELIAQPLPPRLVALTERVLQESADLGPVTPYEIPSGATDAWPFLVAGFEAMAVTCIDPALGAPRHYHRPSDTAENLDPLAFARTFRFVERLIAALAVERSQGG